jgi:hypothetical protein
MEGRIDYVRVRVTGEKGTRQFAQLEYERICKALSDKHGIERKSYDDTLSYDRVLRRWYTNFNVWGELADLFFNNLSEGEFNSVHRLDYRVECTNESLDMELVGYVAVKQAKRKGLRRSFHDGPIQSKSNGRDTGGPSVVIGGVGSQRRISLYQRGHEKPGVEAQISGERLKTVIKAAYDASLVTVYSFHDELRHYMHKELETLCRERLCFPLSAFGDGGEITTDLPIQELDERVYAQMSLLWEFMSPDMQGEFREAISYDSTMKDFDVPLSFNDTDEMGDELDRMEAFDREMDREADEEDADRLNAELERIKRDWPYHNLPGND